METEGSLFCNCDTEGSVLAALRCLRVESTDDDIGDEGSDVRSALTACAGPTVLTNGFSAAGTLDCGADATSLVRIVLSRPRVARGRTGTTGPA